MEVFTYNRRNALFRWNWTWQEIGSVFFVSEWWVAYVSTINSFIYTWKLPLCGEKEGEIGWDNCLQLKTSGDYTRYFLHRWKCHWKLVPWRTDGHLRLPCSTFCWCSQITEVWCQVTEPLGQNWNPAPIRPAQDTEDSWYGNLQSLSLTLSEPIDQAWGHIWRISDSRDLDLDLESGKKILSSCITHRALLTYRVSSPLTILMSEIMDSTFRWSGQIAFSCPRKRALHFALIKQPEFGVMWRSPWGESKIRLLTP